MADPFLSEVRIFSFDFAPRSWAKCDGQILPIAQHTALFSLVGTLYGGDGKSTFGLPNLMGRTPLNAGQGNGLTNREQGKTGGASNVTLNVDTLPQHNHGFMVRSDLTTESPQSNFVGARDVYRPNSSLDNSAVLNAKMVGTTGNSDAHDNQQPFLVLNYCIALSGTFPHRN